MENKPEVRIKEFNPLEREPEGKLIVSLESDYLGVYVLGGFYLEHKDIAKKFDVKIDKILGGARYCLSTEGLRISEGSIVYGEIPESIAGEIGMKLRKAYKEVGINIKKNTTSTWKMEEESIERWRNIWR